MDPYATHLEALVETAVNSKGPILELGCGHYSTPILQAIATSQDRRFLVQASNPEWASHFTEGSDVEIVDWKTWSPPEGRWGMVFLDSEEAVRDRIKRLPVLSRISEVVVMHDADVALSNETFRGLIENYKSLQLYHKHKPWTAVLTPK